MERAMDHMIVVSNVGAVYHGEDEKKARQAFEEYSLAIVSEVGEEVSWLVNGNLFAREAGGKEVRG